MSNDLSKSPVARFTDKWQSLARVYEEYAKSKGLTYMSFTVLEIIYNNQDCCTQKLICEQSLYTKQSVNSIVKVFWEQGYVELKEEKADRRNKRILLTEMGRLYTDDIIGKCSTIEQEAMEHLSNEQWEQLIEMAETFGKHFMAGITGLIKEAEED